MQEVADPKASRFAEPAKFVPVLFICAQIGGLWFVYIFYHCVPMLQRREHVSRAWTQIISFNCAAIMLVVCYVRSIMTHPGTIPDREAVGHSLWEYVPQDRGSDPYGVGTTETKRSGERRHCKWCAKYKPDRCHHCRVCRMCILKMDHHCPWIYNCVGFYNHKFFFLLLFYTVIATHIIAWTMVESVRQNVDPATPFGKMFALLFGQTLATFLCVLVTLFFGFHIWLTYKSMTTIEFCEKSMKRAGYDASAWDRGGFLGNLRGVLGDNPLLWLLPVSTPVGDGLTFAHCEDTPLRLSKDMETGRDLRKKTHEQMGQKSKRKKHAGTGECADASGQDSESSVEHYGSAQDLAVPLSKSGESSGLGGSS